MVTARVRATAIVRVGVRVRDRVRVRIKAGVRVKCFGVTRGRNGVLCVEVRVCGWGWG